LSEWKERATRANNDRSVMATTIMQRKERKKPREKPHLSLLRERGAVAGADLLDVDTVEIGWNKKENSKGKR